MERQRRGSTPIQRGRGIIPVAQRCKRGGAVMVTARVVLVTTLWLGALQTVAWGKPASVATAPSAVPQLTVRWWLLGIGCAALVAGATLAPGAGAVATGALAV